MWWIGEKNLEKTLLATTRHLVYSNARHTATHADAQQALKRWRLPHELANILEQT